MGASINSLEWPIFFRRPTSFFSPPLVPSSLGFPPLFTSKHVGVCYIYPGPEGEGKFVSTCCWRKGGSWRQASRRSTCFEPNDRVKSPPKRHETEECALLFLQLNWRSIVDGGTMTQFAGGGGAIIEGRGWLCAAFDPHVRKRSAQLAKLVPPALKRNTEGLFLCSHDAFILCHVPHFQAHDLFRHSVSWCRIVFIIRQNAFLTSLRSSFFFFFLLSQ